MTRREKIGLALKTVMIGAAYVLVLAVLLYPALEAGRWVA